MGSISNFKNGLRIVILQKKKMLQQIICIQSEKKTKLYLQQNIWSDSHMSMNHYYYYW